MKHGFITVAAAIPSVKVADCDYNEKQLRAIHARTCFVSNCCWMRLRRQS